MRSGLRRSSASVKAVDAGEMGAVAAGARDQLGMAVEQERRALVLHDRAQSALARLIRLRSSARRKTQQHGGDVAGGKRRGKRRGEAGGSSQPRRHQIEARGRDAGRLFFGRGAMASAW